MSLQAIVALGRTNGQFLLGYASDPWIDQVNPTALKAADVARGYAEAARGRDSSDQSVEPYERTTAPFTRGDELPISTSGQLVEPKDPITEGTFEKVIE